MNLKGLLLLFISTGFLISYGQQSGGSKELDLIMPRETKAGKPRAEDLSHSVELAKEQAILTLNGKKQLVPYNLLSEFLRITKLL